MKKSFVKFMMMLAIALPTVMMTSCSDDDDEDTQKPGASVNIDDFKLDGEAFVKQNWLEYDENGNVTGAAVGKALDAAEPTVMYVGVKELLEAQLHFNFRVAPAVAKMVEHANGDYEAILKDTLGVEQNRILFTVVNDGNVLAKVRLQKNIGIEKYITEIRYIPENLWPENSNTENLPFQVGEIYTHNGKEKKNFVCISIPENGNSGLLVSSVNDYHPISAFLEVHAYNQTIDYPNVNTALQISKELNWSDMSDKLWKQLCATAGQTDLKAFKQREYWTSTIDSDDILVINLSAVDKKYFLNTNLVVNICGLEIGEYDRRYVLNAYEYILDKNGEVRLKVANNGPDIYIDTNQFTRNVELERKAETIQYQ